MEDFECPSGELGFFFNCSVQCFSRLLIFFPRGCLNFIGELQVAGPGTVYSSALDKATRLCNWPLPTEESGWGTKYSVTKLS